MVIKSFITTLLFAAIFLPATGQQTPISYEDLQQYYATITQAELNITESKIYDAINDYRSASKIKPLSFTDRLNLIQCFLDSERMNEAVGTVIQMSKDGYRMQFLYDKKYEDLINDENWIYFVAHEYTSPPISLYTKNIVHMMDNVRQYYEIISPERKLVYMSLITESLKSLISKEGFPSEVILEYGSRENTKTQFNNMVQLCIQEDGFNYDSLLYEELLKGHVEPENLLQFFNYGEDQNCGCISYQNTIFLMLGDSLYSCSEKQEDIANENRKRLFLPTIAESKKFISFQLTNVKYNLRGAVNGAIEMEFPDQEKRAAYLDKNSARIQLVRVRKPNEIFQFTD